MPRPRQHRSAKGLQTRTPRSLAATPHERSPRPPKPSSFQNFLRLPWHKQPPPRSANVRSTNVSTALQRHRSSQPAKVGQLIGATSKVPRKLPRRDRHWIGNIGSILLLLMIGSAVSGFGWLSIQFLINPKSIIWVNAYLPQPLQFEIPDWDQPYTLAEIKQQLQKSGHSMGESIRLSNQAQADILIPVLTPDDACSGSQNNCNTVTELRVYRPARHPYRETKTQHFQIIDQLPISGINNWLIQAPFLNAQVDIPPPSDRQLEFSQIEKLDQNAPKGGTWLTLKGERPQQGLYGQILLYSPKTSSLATMAAWSSPQGKLPVWENVASGGTPELVVDQTIGLETQYQIYSLQPDSRNSSGLNLSTIDLTQPAIKEPAYTEALQLARHGLWSLALQQLDRLDKAIFRQNGVAQLQHDAIAYHAKRFQSQADRESANTSQQVQGYLLDGRWDKAIAVVKATPSDRADIQELLNADAGQLLRRFNMALKVTPNNAALQAWNAAAKLARNGQAAAIAWLKTQPTNADRNKLLADLAPALQPSPKPISPKPSAQSTAQRPPQIQKPPPQIAAEDPDWGNVLPVKSDDPADLRPSTKPNTKPILDNAPERNDPLPPLEDSPSTPSLERPQ